MLGRDITFTTAEFSPDGETVLTGGDDGKARLWSAHTEQPLLKVLGRHSGNEGVSKASYSSDGRLEISAGKDGTARIWRRNGQAVATLPHKGPVNDAVIDGDTAVTASDDGTAGIWRASDGQPLRTLRHGAPINALAVSKGVEMIATGGDDDKTRLWSRNGLLLVTLPQGSPVTSVDFGRRDTMLVTAGEDGTAKIWKVPEGTLWRTLFLDKTGREGHSDAIVQAMFSPNGRWVATASRDETARFWDATTGKQRAVLKGDNTPMTSLDFNTSGSLLVTTTRGGETSIWRTRTKELKLLHEPLKQHHAVSDADFSSDGRWLVTAGAPLAHVWNVRTGKQLFSPRGHVGRVASVAFSPKGWRILTAGADRKDRTVRTFSCEVCVKLPGLVALGKKRLDHLRPWK